MQKREETHDGRDILFKAFNETLTSSGNMLYHLQCVRMFKVYTRRWDWLEDLYVLLPVQSIGQAEGLEAWNATREYTSLHHHSLQNTASV